MGFVKYILTCVFVVSAVRGQPLYQDIGNDGYAVEDYIGSDVDSDVIDDYEETRRGRQVVPPDPSGPKPNGPVDPGTNGPDPIGAVAPGPGGPDPNGPIAPGPNGPGPSWPGPFDPNPFGPNTFPNPFVPFPNPFGPNRFPRPFGPRPFGPRPFGGGPTDGRSPSRPAGPGWKCRDVGSNGWHCSKQSSS